MKTCHDMTFCDIHMISRLYHGSTIILAPTIWADSDHPQHLRTIESPSVLGIYQGANSMTGFDEQIGGRNLLTIQYVRCM